MRETPGGLLEPVVNRDACDRCGLCLRVCSGKGLPEDFSPSDRDIFEGACLSAWQGYAADDSIRQRGQSGGYATALLSHLLDTGQIGGALVAEMPPDGRLRPRPLLARSSADLIRSQGSLYCPVPLLEALREIDLKRETLAVVALPCQVQSIQLARARFPAWRDGIALVLGLICDRTLSYLAIEYLSARRKSNGAPPESMRYRDKSAGGWPGDVSFARANGQKDIVSSRWRLLCKERFTPLRCRLCFDKMNVFSDISLGDAWGVAESRQGHSVAICRTQNGARAFESAVRSGCLVAQPTEYAQILKGQGIGLRRQSFRAAVRACAKLGLVAPSVPGMAEASPAAEAAVRASRGGLVHSLALQRCRDSAGFVARADRAIWRRQILLRIRSLAARALRLK